MVKVIPLLFVIFIVFKLCLSNEEEPPEVDTPLGRVRGYWKMTEEGKTYAAFEGIPYAKPPVGDLRFEEAQPIPPWLGTWEAVVPYTCPQVSIMDSGLDLQGQEDCLYINVYVPENYLGSSKKLDVVVIIHGGAFMMGSGHVLVHSQFVMDHDIVFVTFNYRLGPLGFLSTEDDAIPGNNGLKDQVLALKWIKDNIASFRGNPDSVTISGISAGGASVHFHYFSPLAKGLFNRGMSQSGTVLMPWAIKKNPLQNAKKLATFVGCPDKSTVELKKCLKQRPLENLMKYIAYFTGYGTMPFSPFAPVIEKGSNKPFIDKDPYVLLKEGKVLDAPWIASHTADDGLFPTASYYEQLDYIDEYWADLFPLLMDCNETLPESRREVVAKKVLEHYLGPGVHIIEDLFEKWTQIFTDRLFAVGGELAATLQAKVTKSPVYYYVFSYRDGENKAVRFLTESPFVDGVSHADDGIYFYGIVTVTPFSHQDKRLKKACQNMLFKEYASSGKPSFDGTDKWQPVGTSEFVYLNITGPELMKLEKTGSLSPIEFWNGLGLLEYDKTNVKDEL